MKIWAEIYKSKVIALHKTPDDFTVVFSPQSFRFAKDITNVSPQPAVGWSHDFETGTFSVPDTVYLNPITSKDFFLRMTGPERVAMIGSVDNQVKQFHYWLSLTGDVDLTDPIMTTACTMLENEGIIAPGRAAELLTIATI